MVDDIPDGFRHLFAAETIIAVVDSAVRGEQDEGRNTGETVDFSRCWVFAHEYLRPGHPFLFHTCGTCGIVPIFREKRNQKRCFLPEMKNITKMCYICNQNQRGRGIYSSKLMIKDNENTCYHRKGPGRV